MADTTAFHCKRIFVGTNFLRVCIWTKWQPFCRRKVHVHFLERKILYCNFYLLKFIPNGPFDDYKYALVHVMTWCQTDDKPLYAQMLTVSPGLIELKFTVCHSWNRQFFSPKTNFNSLQTSICHGCLQAGLAWRIGRSLNYVNTAY